MSDNDRFDPGAARSAMDTDTVPYDDLAIQVRTAVDAVCAARTVGDLAEQHIEQILQAMWETHESMRSVLSMAARVEAKEGRTTGRWMDAVLLARPQYDAAFIALLLVHDPDVWVTRYRKAGWAANAIRSFYVLRRFSNTEEGKMTEERTFARLQEHARHVGVTRREWNATTAEVRGRERPAGTTSNDVVKPLPTPGRAREELGDSQYGRLADLLWQQWKQLCDPAHVGVGLLINKAGLRGDGDLDRPRKEFIESEVVARSILPSFAAMMTVVTLIAARHRDNPDLLARVVLSWEHLERGTVEGGIIWDGWAREALGVLAQDDRVGPPDSGDEHGQSA